MKNSFLNLNGVKKLDNSELKTISGGRVKCTYSDGLGWDLSYKTSQAEFLAGDHCVKTGGKVEFYDGAMQ
ncbi:bacteriocin [Tenacibaculum agarivorans]|uniref:bacteriocin n=1 Tax=Tenacibaculum agarivorans TaxID=1908389 RepID=UPI00094B9603|nr:bacteriocin [Tenacibaculum agarivorans]